MCFLETLFRLEDLWLNSVKLYLLLLGDKFYHYFKFRKYRLSLTNHLKKKCNRPTSRSNLTDNKSLAEMSISSNSGNTAGNTENKYFTFKEAGTSSALSLAVFPTKSTYGKFS